MGVEIHPIYEQHRVVDEAINDFIVNLAMSVVIVIAVLMLFMGWRVGMVVGATLLLTVLGTVLPHARVQYRDGADLARRADHRHGDAGR